MNDPHIIAIGERIRQIREEKNMMWQEIEEASGLCDSVLRYMAKGRRDAGVTKYIALAPALGVSLDYLLTGKESVEPETAELAETIQDVSQQLMDASFHGHTEVVKVLLEAGVNAHARDDYALRYASYHGHTEVVKLLLEAGADVHTWDDYALRSASYHGRAELVRVLLEAGADVHTWDDYALRSASYHGRAELVRVLLEAGADAGARDDHALRSASYRGHDEVVKILTDWKEANK